MQSGAFAALMIAGSGDLGGVAGPVASGLVRPFHCGGGVQVEQLGEHGGGQLDGEVEAGGSATGLGADAECSQPVG